MADETSLLYASGCMGYELPDRGGYVGPVLPVEQRLTQSGEVDNGARVTAIKRARLVAQAA